ncbi:MAG: adenosylmethionine--8-amino-7-oxononanoate transaminase, partial [Spirochaetaceae bacterium]|nr:adenosylmethionine--8-amino-7-oxononanoate transaminase [Spirochaetaceae bacterium]
MNWEREDLRHIWHPCSQMKDYEDLPPIVIERGEGSYLYDIYGKEYIDIVGSWWCNLLGHCNPKINAAIAGQLETLEHVIFVNFTHKPAVQYARRLAALLPPGLTKLHFSDNGSSAVECALKMSFQFFAQTETATRRQRFMCLTSSYHGETIGALAVGSMDLFTEIYKPLLNQAYRIPAPDCYRCPRGQSRDTCRCECAAFAEELFARHGAECCALIVEPLVQGAGGMKMYPPEYLRVLRELCDTYGVILIADEIATGFGRTGTLFACEQAGITPDLMCLSKSITGGYLPFSLVAATQRVYDAFYADYSASRAFMHSHTYSGNPLGCAAALAVLDILEHDAVLESARQKAPVLHGELCAALEAHPNVGEIRHIGLINALELVADKSKKTPLESRERWGYRVYKKALSMGLVLRPLGDVLYFNPALTTSQTTLSTAVQ